MDRASQIEPLVLDSTHVDGRMADPATVIVAKKLNETIALINSLIAPFEVEVDRLEKKRIQQ